MADSIPSATAPRWRDIAQPARLSGILHQIAEAS